MKAITISTTLVVARTWVEADFESKAEWEEFVRKCSNEDDTTFASEALENAIDEYDIMEFWDEQNTIEVELGEEGDEMEWDENGYNPY